MSTVAQYAKYFGLDSDPFDSDDVVEKFFPAGMRQNYLDQLLHLVRYGSDMITITGESGSGKATLLNFFISELDTDIVVAQVHGTVATNPHQLLTHVLEQFQLGSVVDEGTLQETGYNLADQLMDFSRSVEEDARIVLVIVDNAHELGNETIDTLLKLASDQSGVNNLRIVLVGQPGLTDTLENSSLCHDDGRFVANLELPSFSLDETANYIYFRLRAYGFTEELPFNKKQLEKIRHESKGFPQAINNVAREEMISMCEPKKGFTFGLPVPHMALLVVIITVLIFSMMLRDESSDDDRLKIAAKDGLRRIDLPLGNLSANQSATLTEHDARGRVVSLPPVEALPQRAGLSEALDEALPPVAAALIDTRQELFTGNAFPEPIVQVEEPSPVVADNEAYRVGNIVQRDDSPSQQPDRSVAMNPLPVETISPVPASLNGEDISSGVSTVSDQELKLLSLNPDNFTLQMLGSWSESNVQDFIRDNGSGDVFSYFETRYQDRPWFVVVFGTYTNSAAAVDAISNLTPRLQNQQPWVRGLRGIQEDIRKNNP